MSLADVPLKITLQKPTVIFGAGDISWCDLKRLGILPAGTVCEINPLLRALDYQGVADGFYACTAETPKGSVTGYIRAHAVPELELAG